MDHQRLSMPIGQAMFTQLAIRRMRPDPIAIEDIHFIMDAASKAPNGGDQQIARFLVVTDREPIRQFGALYQGELQGRRPDRWLALLAPAAEGRRPAATVATLAAGEYECDGAGGLSHESKGLRPMRLTGEGRRGSAPARGSQPVQAFRRRRRE